MLTIISPLSLTRLEHGCHVAYEMWRKRVSTLVQFISFFFKDDLCAIEGSKTLFAKLMRSKNLNLSFNMTAGSAVALSVMLTN